MKILNNSKIIYLIIVILPIIISSSIYVNAIINHDYQQRLERTAWTASAHQKVWEQLISETVTTLEILSLSVEFEFENSNLANIEPLLQKTQMMDPRFGGIYLLNPEGTVISGSNHLLQYDDLSQDQYIKEISRTNDIIISNQEETLTNGEKVIGIGKPILNDGEQLTGMLVANLRIDHLQNIMKEITPFAKITILNANGQSMINLNSGESTKTSSQDSITVPIEGITWSIQVANRPCDHKTIAKNSLIFIFHTAIICHIIYILLKYYMFKKQTIRKMKENEVQKLELVGLIASTTAHEIRNPLTGIKGLIKLLSEKYPNSQDQLYFSIINGEIKRINEIVSEFLVLGKPTVQKNERVNLLTTFNEIAPLIQSEAALNRMTFELQLPPEPVFVMCTADQLKQVILNITKNAFESMREGGKITINLIQQTERCQIQIIDTGSGIPEEHLENIFQPFYTSKEMGTGLGLVVCQRIIESFAGEIQIKSQVGRGTTVNIFLPIHMNHLLF